MVPFFFLENWKATVRKFILNNSNPLVHLLIQSYSFTNCVLTFKALLTPPFSKLNFSEYLSMTSSYFCRIADLHHPFSIYFLYIMSYLILSHPLATSGRVHPRPFSSRKYFRKWILITYIHLIYPLDILWSDWRH